MVLSGGGLMGVPGGGLPLLEQSVLPTAGAAQAAGLETVRTVTKTEFLDRAPSRQATDLGVASPHIPGMPDAAEPPKTGSETAPETASKQLPAIAWSLSTVDLDADPPIALVDRHGALDGWALDESARLPPVISRIAEGAERTGANIPSTVLLDTPALTEPDRDRSSAIAPAVPIPSLESTQPVPLLDSQGAIAVFDSPLQVAADPGNPSLPPPLPCPNPDPELGCLLLDGFTQGKPPILYLTPRIDFFRSNNLLLGIVPISDGLVRSSLSLLAVPPLDANTFLLAGIEGAFSRYLKVPIYNYDELKLRVGILRRLSPAMTAELGWINQQLFIANNEIPQFPYGTRFLNEHIVQLTLSRRDTLSDRLSLNSLYQFRWGFAQPNTLSRLFNVLFLSLNYDVNRQRTVQVGLDYQFSAANYTDVPRTDLYQQILGRVSMQVVRNTQFSLYGGLSFGSSTSPTVDFNGVVLGVSLAVNWGLF